MRATVWLPLGSIYHLGPIQLEIGKICGTAFQLVVKAPSDVLIVRYSAWRHVFGELGNGTFKSQGESQRHKNVRWSQQPSVLDRFMCRRGRALVVDQDILLSVVSIRRSGVKLRIRER